MKTPLEPTSALAGRRPAEPLPYRFVALIMAGDALLDLAISAAIAGSATEVAHRALGQRRGRIFTRSTGLVFSSFVGVRVRTLISARRQARSMGVPYRLMWEAVYVYELGDGANPAVDMSRETATTLPETIDTIRWTRGLDPERVWSVIFG